MRRFLRRGWWKPWGWSTRTWILSICGSVIICPLVSRWLFLWQVPDVSLPFDVEDVIQADIPAEEDAFVRYASAMQFARSRVVNWSHEAIEEALKSERAWDNRLDLWLVQNKLALADFRAAGEMQNAEGPSLRTSDLMTNANLHASFQYLARMAVAEGIREQRAGNLEAAWLNHRAALQCAKHAEKPGFAFTSLVADRVLALACQGIKCWAEHPKLTPEQLRNARLELSLHFSRRSRVVDASKADYLLLRNTLNRHDAPNFLFPQFDTGSPLEPQLLVGKWLFFWSIGQPELTLRTARQLLANNHGQLQKPLNQRQKVVGTKDQLVFELDPQARRPWGQLEPMELDEVLNGSTLVPQFSGRLHRPTALLDQSRNCDEARLAGLTVVLACQEYQRIRDEFPERMQDLVPNYLDSITVDPLDEQGAPLQYRRDSNGEAVVWSIGRNKIDDDGHVDNKEIADQDLGF